MVEPIKIIETVMATLVEPVELGEDLISLTKIDQKKLDKRKADFTSAKQSIFTVLNDSTKTVDDEKDPIFARLTLTKCFGTILDILLGSLSYSESMSLLAVATQNLSDCQE